MSRAGHPYRGTEKPDSPFGKLLKRYIRRVDNFTQKDLAAAAVIPEKTLSEMVKGKRTSGTMLRRDLLAIIRVLFEKKAISSIGEANRLMTAIPAVSVLDHRDPEDADIMRLFKTPETQGGQVADHTTDRVPIQNAHTSPENRSHVSTPDAIPAPELPPLPRSYPPGSETPGISQRERKSRWWYGSLIATAIIFVAVSITGFLFWWRDRGCIENTNGVTLYTDIHYQGHCATFEPGDYELALYGLEGNVSSIKNPNSAYHIKLYDKAKNFYYLDTDAPALPAEWDNRADTIQIEKHRPTTCHPGSDGIIAFINPDYSGGCLFITHDIPDLSPSNVDKAIVSLQFLGSYQNSRQLVIYKQPNYKDECGAYWQDQSDLLQCARIAMSVRVLPFTPPTPLPTIPGTQGAGNVAPQATVSPGEAQAAVDRNLQTEWVGGHMKELDLSWPFPVLIHRVVVWDRKQSASDNNQINKLKLTFSDATATGSLDMVSGGPRCVDVTLPQKTVTWLHIIPVDASGNNGYREVEVWATTGPQYSNNTCVNKKTVTQTVPQTATEQKLVTLPFIDEFIAKRRDKHPTQALRGGSHKRLQK